MEEIAKRIEAITDTYHDMDCGATYEDILETLISDPNAIITYLLDIIENNMED